MVVGVMKIKLHTPWVHSLKEKRMIVKSICAKLRNKFHIAIAEVEEQDKHQVVVLGVTCITDQKDHADSIIEHVISFIEDNTEGELFSIERELLQY